MQLWGLKSTRALHTFAAMATGIRGQRPKGSTEVILTDEEVEEIVMIAKGQIPDQMKEAIKTDAPMLFDQCASNSCGRALIQKHFWILKPVCSMCPLLVPATGSCIAILEGIIRDITQNFNEALIIALAFDLKCMYQGIRRIRRQWRYLTRNHKAPFPPAYSISATPSLVSLVTSLEDHEKATDEDEDDLQASPIVISFHGCLRCCLLSCK